MGLSLSIYIYIICMCLFWSAGLAIGTLRWVLLIIVILVPYCEIFGPRVYFLRIAVAVNLDAIMCASERDASSNFPGS